MADAWWMLLPTTQTCKFGPVQTAVAADAADGEAG